MPRKISEFFQPISKFADSQKRKFDEFSKDIIKSSNVMNAKEELSKEKPQIINNIKIEPEKEFITVLEPNLIKVESNVLHAAKKVKIDDVERLKTVKLEKFERGWPKNSGKISKSLTKLVESEKSKEDWPEKLGKITKTSTNLVESDKSKEDWPEKLGKISKNSAKSTAITKVDKNCKNLQNSGLLKATSNPKAPQVSKNSPQSRPNLQSPSTFPSQPKIIKCKFCPNKFSNYNARSTHLKQFHEDKLHTCDLCNSKCSTMYGIRLHMINMHLNKKFHPFICDYCGKELKSKAKIFYHVLIHRPRIECQICHIKIKHNSMQEHLRDFHVNERKFCCKMCTKTFKAEKDLKRHEKVHLKKFNCQICFRKFRLQYDLNVHIYQIHENPGSFKCEICGMKFNEKVVLKRHKYKHNNKEKNLKCDRCDYASADKQLYKRHLDAHKRKDERDAKLKYPKKCKICLNLYKNETSLAMHMKHSHSGVTYQCDICSKVFKIKRTIVGHMEKHKM